ncbi:thermonuclease family protein [Sporosarcina sp. JAI121]|uniref:thermonuclease family protein n=1 Tax=Sporosarcina sp. JAI121 TaxID=2723064 RepID=UPI0015CAB7B6|nr:thermonuclease family protein [Sporosarcina sp. JAI121]NYF25499.1 micrococcal nuclease [Sporosarcina sp. JAI121]
MKQNKKNSSTLLKKPASIVGIGVALLAMIVYTVFFPDQEPGRDGLIPVELVKTIDGDTIKIMYEGKEQNVRYLLIDTPETNHPRLGKQPFGEKAKERNQELLNSGKLEIEFDIGGKTDKYGRLLAYIYINGISVQEKLLEEGLARVAYVYPPNTRHLDAFEKAEAKAKKAGIGIWTLKNYATDRGFDSETYVEKKTVTKPVSGAKEFFKNCTELRKKYPTGVKQGHPAYSENMDGDKDGFACER